MAKAKKVKAQLQEKKAETVFDIKALTDTEQQTVKALNAELMSSFDAFKNSTLSIGRTLTHLRQILEPKRQWIAYLKTLPAFSTKTAYRYIGQYELTQKALPPLAVSRVIAAGIDMKPSEGKPFGVYTDAVKKHPVPSGESAKNQDKVDEWVDIIQTTYKSTAKKGAQRKSFDQLLKEAFRFVIQRAAKVDEKQQKKFLINLMAYSFNSIGETNDITVTPNRPPEAISGEKEEMEEKQVA